MSKSEGNILLAKDFLKKNTASVLRYLLISANYTKPVNFNQDSLKNAELEVNKIGNALNKGGEKILKSGIISTEMSHDYDSVRNHLLNNIDTVAAITKIDDLVKIVNNADVDEEYSKAYNSLVGALQLLGFEVEIKLTKEMSDLYKVALEAKNYEASDKIRGSVVIYK